MFTEGYHVVERMGRLELWYSRTAWPRVVTVVIELPLGDDVKGSLVGIV